MTHSKHPAIAKALARFALVALVALGGAFSLSPAAMAQRPPAYDLLVRGDSSMTTWYKDGMLYVKFRHSNRAARNKVDPQIGPGEAAWVDRPLNRDEPFTLVQPMDHRSADMFMSRLRSGDTFSFRCYNDKSGMLRSEAAKMVATTAVRID
ncbi:hypothetical protein CR51_36225 [Caballeronia megalochromosomata]|jgi:hypothetical protein|nr:hypothetical protein CR51_36225 [Caballeronia megalochromosomata]